MRDGIPRTIPVPRIWQRFVECADRPADRGTKRVVDRLIDAVRHTFARYFPSEIRKILINIADEAQSTLPGIAPAMATAASSPKTYHLAELLSETQSAIREGGSFQSAIVETLAAKMEAAVAAYNRQIFDLTSKCRPHEIQRVRAEMNRAASLFDARSEAERMLRPPTKDAKPRIEPDEELR